MDLNWTQIIVQAIASAGIVATAAIPLWIKLHRVEKSTNGMLEQLVSAEKGKAMSEGIVQGIESQQAHQDELRGTKEDRRVP